MTCVSTVNVMGVAGGLGAFGEVPGRRGTEAGTDERKVSKQNLPLSTFKIFEISQSEE